MHIFTQLSNEETRSLSNSSIPIIHFHDIFSSKVVFNIMNFLQYNDTNENQTFAKKKEVLSDLLNCNPNYQKRFDFLTAIWGLKMNDIHFILLYSHKGLSIELDADSTSKEANEVLVCLEKILIDK